MLLLRYFCKNQPHQLLAEGLCHRWGFPAPESRRDENVDVAGTDVLVEVLMVEGNEGAAVDGHEEIEGLVCKTLRLARLRPVQDRHLLPLLDQPVEDAPAEQHGPADGLEGDPLLPLEVTHPWLLLVLV